MSYQLDKVLVDRKDIISRVKELAESISKDLVEDYGDSEVVIIPILTGSLIFVSDLIRYISLPLRIEMITVNSYFGGTTNQGANIVGQIPNSLEGKNILVVDDILDTGQTMSLISNNIKKKDPKSFRKTVLLRKKGNIISDVKVDYVGFDIPDSFVVGYGLDYNGYYRNLPDIMMLKESGV